MTTQYVTVEIGTQSCARGRVFNGRGLVRGYNGRWLGRRDNGHINSQVRKGISTLHAQKENLIRYKTGQNSGMKTY